MIAPVDSGTVAIETGISEIFVVTVVVLAGKTTNELVVVPGSLAIQMGDCLEPKLT